MDGSKAILQEKIILLAPFFLSCLKVLGLESKPRELDELSVAFPSLFQKEVCSGHPL